MPPADLDAGPHEDLPARKRPAGARVVAHPLARAVWRTLGGLSLALAFIGVALPLVPTTPFVLLAALAFGRSSPRLYAWLSGHPTFGPLVRDWRSGRGLSLRTKGVAVTAVLLSIGTTGLLFVSSTAVRSGLAVVAVGVCLFLVTRPTKRGDDTRPGSGGGA